MRKIAKVFDQKAAEVEAILSTYGKVQDETCHRHRCQTREIARHYTVYLSTRSEDLHEYSFDVDWYYNGEFRISTGSEPIYVKMLENLISLTAAFYDSPFDIDIKLVAPQIPNYEVDMTTKNVLGIEAMEKIVSQMSICLRKYAQEKKREIMKYQLEYDRVLLCDRPFKLEKTGEIITDISFYVRFGTIFQGETLNEQKVEVGETFSDLSSLLRVSYSQETKKFEFHLHEEYKDGYEICEYFVGVGEGMTVPRICSKEEFDQIIEEYGEYFSSDPALQCCSFSSHVVDDQAEVSPSTKKEADKTCQSLFIKQLEEMLQAEKDRVDSISREGTMAEEYRSEWAKLYNQIQTVENKKDWLINQDNIHEKTSEIVDWYVYLINLYSEYKVFLNKDNLRKE
ncbi:hypothetical protein [Enterococcus sp. BWR-S5]|uniref:hypothetical protein n=1 Tax=Enterococcus sp. BWR-S5 TaxID=2787714 RepID=UPI001922A6B6|nr:hypothetical protein [Enterococcus sp. BWR-S5]MBL1227204.1 hypothetical protein [Enterococcus sp. BWR-S5]